jgi:hypothetical protein
MPKLNDEEVRNRLDLMPDWRLGLDQADWVRAYRAATGCERRWGYRMYELREGVVKAEWDAILHWYKIGQISRASALGMLAEYLRPDLRESLLTGEPFRSAITGELCRMEIDLPSTYEEEREREGEEFAGAEVYWLEPKRAS